MSEELTCADVSDLLDIVAADALAGTDVKRRYPAVLAHFRACSRCRAAYFMLLDALRCQEEATSLLSRIGPPPRLSFLEAEEESAWRRLTGDPTSLLPLSFEISGSFIARALSGPRLTNVRGEPAVEEEKEALLLADWIAGEEGDWVVELVARRRVGRPRTVDLEARLVRDAPAPSNLWASVAWGDQRRSAPLSPEGVATLHDLSLCSLIDPSTGRIESDLTISFDVQHAREGESA
jgi:hypothetical protein